MANTSLDRYDYGKSLDEAFSGGLRSGQSGFDTQQKAQIAQDTSDRNIAKLQALLKSGALPQGAGASLSAEGGATIQKGYNTMSIAPHQAQAFLGNASKLYKPINDQLDASQTTLDNLNLGNSTGDRLALLNEARLALAGSGGRAFGMVISQLAGDPTMAQNTQKAM